MQLSLAYSYRCNEGMHTCSSDLKPACELSVSIVLGTYYFIVVRSFDLVLHDLVLLFVPQYEKGAHNRFGVNIHAMTNEWHRLL